ncbi:MAG: type II toxin-antitoxin system Phd/YefM family antitoxin [Deltaproteobacteria bacterium]|nr:type II toxin-antitoxin system Phd/YefM family antitoxin [Deltaproteobacteria bacterium]
MRNLNVSQARKELPSLIDEVASGKRGVLVTRRGKPVARIVPFRKKDKQANAYPLRGKPIGISKDFDEPLPGLWDALRT